MAEKILSCTEDLLTLHFQFVDVLFASKGYRIKEHISICSK